MCGVGFEFCLPVRVRTQTGNLIFRAKKARNCPPVPIRAGIGQASCLTASYTEAGCLGYFI